MPGFVAIFLALVATGAAGFCYLHTYLAAATGKKRTGALAYGTLFYRLAALGIAAAAVYLYYLILSDNFHFAYVYGYSARDLALPYKISVFWAGQEGSFLLWAVLHACFGLMLARRHAPGTMAVYSGLQLMLLAALLAKSPFMALAVLRPDGFGLNPLLQDPWMVVHPPVIFLGYALLAVPFATALDALMTGRHKEWVDMALPWTLGAWCALGAGIFIGAYWAYKVLGWGGYWAWDPVENASLIPWLACGALLHLLLLARVSLAAVKPAYFAAQAGFVLVLYGTFLTRSGILSNFSTHSFADEGIGGLLAGFIAITAAVALVILIIRWPRLPAGAAVPAWSSRECFLAAAALLFAALDLVVLVGTSAPLVTMLSGRPQSVGVAFYNITTLPLAALLAAALAAGTLFGWGAGSGGLFRRYRWALLAAAAVFGLVAKTGLPGVLPPVAVGLAAAAGAASVLALRHGLINQPAGITHIGFAVALIGIVVSSCGSQSTTLSLTVGAPQQVYGTDITYLGEQVQSDGRGLWQNFRLGDAAVQPYTKLKDGQPVAREPGILHGLLADLYIAPLAKQQADPYQQLVLHKRETVKAGDLTVNWRDLTMTSAGFGGDIRVAAALTVTVAGSSQAITAELVGRNGQFAAVPVEALERYELVLTAVNTREDRVEIGVRDMLAPPPPPRIDVEVSRKPLINLVWLGALLVTGGLVWAWRARAVAVHQYGKGLCPATGMNGEARF